MTTSSWYFQSNLKWDVNMSNMKGQCNCNHMNWTRLWTQPDHLIQIYKMMLVCGLDTSCYLFTLVSPNASNKRAPQPPLSRGPRTSQHSSQPAQTHGPATSLPAAGVHWTPAHVASAQRDAQDRSASGLPQQYQCFFILAYRNTLTQIKITFIS